MSESTEQGITTKTNWFVRGLISLFCLLLTAMVGYRFVWVEPRGDVNPGVITLLCFILVLVLAESFDSFSVGKLVSISREKKKKEKEVEKLEKQNAQLLSQLISVSNTQSQNQNHTNVYGDYHVAAPSVRKASEEEVEEVRDTQTAEASAVRPQQEQARLRINWRKVEEVALQKYMQRKSIDPSNLIKDAKMVNQFQGIDPISSQQIIFDGYLKEQEHETFIDVRPDEFFSLSYRDRLYVMLSKINHYRVAKRADAHLEIVLARVPGAERPRMGLSRERLLENFEPAIAGGLLKVVSIDFSEEEAALFREPDAN